MRYFIIILVSIVMNLASSIYAKDFGKISGSFYIKEEGFLSMIQRKLNNINIEEENIKMRKIVQRKINQPSDIQGISETIQERSFVFDPTYTLKENIKLPNGEILYKAGTKVNPLDHMDFDRKLFFINSNSNNQVKWLQQQLEKASIDKKEIKVILVAGKPLKLSEDLGFNVYFDQFGELTKKFGIGQVPATIIQEKNTKFLRIEEILIEKNN